MAITSRVRSLVIYYSELATDDERASDVEQLEKVLYCYPPLAGDYSSSSSSSSSSSIWSADPTATGALLNHLSFVEGLVAFAATFARGGGNASEPLESVHLEQRRFAFLEAEPAVWMVLELADSPPRDHHRWRQAAAATAATAAAAAAATSVGAHGSTGGGGGGGGGDGAVVAWPPVDDASLLSTMQQLYETLTLLHGPLLGPFRRRYRLPPSSETSSSSSSSSSSSEGVREGSATGLEAVRALQALRKERRKTAARVVMGEDAHRDLPSSPSSPSSSSSEDNGSGTGTGTTDSGDTPRAAAVKRDVARLDFLERVVRTCECASRVHLRVVLEPSTAHLKFIASS
jgi:hypothetical protein